MVKKTSNLPSLEEFQNFLNLSTDILRNKKAVCRIDHGPVLFVGDIHGNFQNVVNAIKLGISKAVKHIVFLGDYTDRGSEQTRSLLNVSYCQIAKDIKYQTFDFIDPILYETSSINFSVLRGNHEDVEINKRYGFKSELRSLYGTFPETILENFYTHFPVLAETRWKSFAAHGGIPKPTENFPASQFLKILRELNLPIGYRAKPNIDPEILKMIYQILWNDPNDNKETSRGVFYPSFRGNNIFTFNETAFNEFLKETGYKRMIRSHESTRGAYQIIWKGKIIYIFSAYPRFNQYSSATYFLEYENGKGEILDTWGSTIVKVKN
jgi:hypothetical protein